MGTYKKSEQAGGEDVLIYFWDNRDGDAFSGWWFGPKVGGDQVWAYHANKTSMVPPTTGWRVPFNGDIDSSMQLKAGGAVGGVAGLMSPQKPGLAPAGGMMTPQNNAQMLAQKQKEIAQKQKEAQEARAAEAKRKTEEMRVKMEEVKKKKEEEMAKKKEADAK